MDPFSVKCQTASIEPKQKAFAGRMAVDDHVVSLRVERLPFRMEFAGHMEVVGDFSLAVMSSHTCAQGNDAWYPNAVDLHHEERAIFARSITK